MLPVIYYRIRTLGDSRMGMDLLRRHKPATGFLPIVDDRALCRFVRFGLLNLPRGGTHRDGTGDEEACLVLLNGRCTVAAAKEKWEGLGARNTVFDGRPYSVYIPRDASFQVSTEEGCSLAICRAPAKTKRVPRVIPPDQVKSRTVGKWNWRREVCDIMGNDSTIPETLIVGETINPPGNWSSVPPHKHDSANLPVESKLEEIYFYKLRPPQGFGLQRLYTKEGDIDETYVIRDGDTLVIPRGYHPVVAAPGYSLYYLWVLAGEKRMMKPNDDPEHSWLKNCEPIISEVETSSRS